MAPQPDDRHTLEALAEQVRRACVETALDAYETARTDGLCAEGAYEVAVDAMRRLDLAALIQAAGDQTSSR